VPVLVTGISPQSIGADIAKSIASQQPSALLLASRTKRNLETVASNIKAAFPTVSLHTIILDLSSQADIRRACSEISTLVPHIDVLINNAGVNNRTRQYTEEGIELQFGVNHIGPFLLTSLLHNKLKAAAKQPGTKPGATRVVNVTSQGHRISPVRFSDYNFHRDAYDVPDDEKPRQGLPEAITKGVDGYPTFIAYGQSKTANILHAVAVGDKWGDDSIYGFSVHPGSELFPLFLLLQSCRRENE
jgi:NAD(P)-dependent dehydrogenase (short-subunit alcohol dehydrogenase family)